MSRAYLAALLLLGAVGCGGDGASQSPTAPLTDFVAVSFNTGIPQCSRAADAAYSCADTGREGFTAVSPDAVDAQWNDGRGRSYRKEDNTGVDDVAFISALIDQWVGTPRPIRWCRGRETKR